MAYCPEELHLSANYFGDLIKKETGQSAKDYLLNKTIEITKIVESDKTVNEIAYNLGFNYPQNFTRFFLIATATRQTVERSPMDFRGELQNPTFYP